MSEPWQRSPRLRLLARGLLAIASCAAPARADDAIVDVLTLELGAGLIVGPTGQALPLPLY